MSGEVTLRVAREEDGTLYKNLFNIYQNELGMYCGEFQDVDSAGYFDEGYTQAFFKGDPSVIPLVIEYDGRIVGFAVVTAAPYCPEGYDFCMQELFVVGYYRGKGVAEAAVERLFSAVKGRYVAAVPENNGRAVGFFRKAFGADEKERPYGNGFILFSRKAEA